METLIDAQKQGDATAQAVASFVSRLQEGDGMILLTSRSVPPADWGQCDALTLSGLSEDAGADLFLAHLSPDRQPAASRADRIVLSRRVQGHPLSIRLLAGRFDEHAPSLDLATFLHSIETELHSAEQATPASLEDPARQKNALRLHGLQHQAPHRRAKTSAARL